MADTWSTVGSCAQVGSDVHLSGGVGIGGVVEPPQAAPVVIEDEAFIGTRSMVTEGARPKELPGGTFGFPCALIIKRFAEGERHDKAALNAVLREHGVAT